MEKLILNKDISIVLPQFDTSGILEKHVENIILHLYLSGFSSQTHNQKIHLTINPFNEETKDFEDGVSVSRCDKIILHFWIRNNSELAASNVDIKATSFILQEKNVGTFSPSDLKNSYEHNLHLITDKNSGRQPFVLGLDKKAIKYFNDGTVKVKLTVNVKYNGLNEGKKYWSESAFIYSPIFENHAKEIYSKGN